MIKVKIFHGQGGERLEQMEGRINKWLSAGDPNIVIDHTDTALCSLGNGDGELYQQFIITI